MLSTVTWTGGGGNALWSNAKNWSSGIVPASADAVVIGSKAAVDDDTSATVNSLQIQSGAMLNANSVTLDTGTLTMSAGSTLEITAGTVSIANGFTNHGRIEISANEPTLSSSAKGPVAVSAGETGGSLTVTNGTLVNATDGMIVSTMGVEGLTSVITADLDNQGVINVTYADFAINPGTGASANTLTNEANGTIDVGADQTLSIGGASVTDNGAIEIGRMATVNFSAPTVTIHGQGTLQGQSTSTVKISGSLLGNTTNVADFHQPGTFILDGNGTVSSPQKLELMELGQGNVTAGYAGSLAYGMLQLGSDTYVELVDQFHNSSSGSNAEAGYTHSLLVPTGTTLNLDGLQLYARDAQIAGSTVGTPVVGPPATTTIGLYNQAASKFYLRNTNDSGYADETFSFGAAGAGWIPISGDWEGNGTITTGLYNPKTSVFYLRNTNTAGYADTSFQFGPAGLPAGSQWIPIAGDWEGNGTDTVGLYNPTTSAFFLRNTNDSGYADETFSFGAAGAGWLPVVGDWTGGCKDTIGLYNPKTSTFYLRNSDTSGYANATFTYGPAGGGWKPLAGDWDGNGSDTIGLYNPTTSAFCLRNSNSSGYANMTFVYGSAGGGWSPIAGNWIYGSDSRSADDEAFASAGSSGQLRAVDPHAVDQIDLSNVVEHQLGHVVGLT
jgi:hypothetical protein